MNFQTTKARAVFSGGSWIVSHPGTLHSVITSFPHDTARYLIEKFVLRNQIAQRGKS